ncbi:MAG: hypothetical protein N3A02_00305 [Rectinema sp.]|nr:hypothetical protein [Rectinema sp.]
MNLKRGLVLRPFIASGLCLASCLTGESTSATTLPASEPTTAKQEQKLFLQNFFRDHMRRREYEQAHNAVLSQLKSLPPQWEQDHPAVAQEVYAILDRMSWDRFSQAAVERCVAEIKKEDLEWFQESLTKPETQRFLRIYMRIHDLSLAELNNIAQHALKDIMHVLMRALQDRKKIERQKEAVRDSGHKQ